ncbi:MAG: RIP metalloprotease RseP [bacterium]|nr:RIP metalloprotease RseP [bacterium]
MLLSLASFVLVLGVLILVHELGHFMAAKAVGIAVPRFSIGLGPATPLKFKRGETEYQVSWLPIGGYVKMASLEEQEAMAALEGGQVEQEFPPDRLFESKPLAARILVIIAGVIMNVLFAWAAYTLLFAAYGPFAARLGEATAGEPAEVAGLQAGDLVTHVDGEPLASWRALVATVQDSGGATLRFTVDRDGGSLDVPVTPVLGETPHPVTGKMRRVQRIGAGPSPEGGRIPLALGAAIAEGGAQTWDHAGLVLAFVKGLVLGQVSLREIGGPVMIGKVSGQAARLGGSALLSLMAFLSVNLAILNLLPIPALDGGHLIFLILEGLRGGKPLSQEVRMRLTQIGIYVLLAIMAFALINDLLRLARG